MAIEPVTREERFLAAAGGQSVTPPEPITRKEQLLQGIIDAVKSGGVTPDVIEGAVNDYLNANPVKPGATTEQAAQIEQNKNDIADLQTDVDELKESGGNGSGQNVELDSTLTVEGKAADAKAVGDTLAGKVGGIGITTIMAITQEDYDELVMLGTVDESTLYIIKPESEDGPDMTMIPVLRSDGTAYIKLDMTPVAGARYEVCFRGIEDIPVSRVIFGNKGTNVSVSGGSLASTWMSGFYLGSSYASYGQVDLSKKHVFQVTPTALILDGEEKVQITAGVHPVDKQMGLFAGNLYGFNNNNNQAGADYWGPSCAIDFFFLRIWSSGDELLHNYVPAQDSEGVACIYDTVDKAYLYNAAEAGAFEYREELEES